ncbi:hypothetical protein [Helicobacter cetorum]|uniref:hypothetical protein n=1 Tax=Helicobacter cetorum TaxID=138563 RepID=UPI0018F81A80|nr:hypothetical protein [Helicobacter cetorum]
MGIGTKIASAFGFEKFSVTGNMKVKTLKADFKKHFGASLRIYKGNQFAPEDATLASIKQTKAKVEGKFWAHSSDKVGEFEKKMLETFGIKVQVANKADTKLSNNNLTLEAAGKE